MLSNADIRQALQLPRPDEMHEVAIHAEKLRRSLKWNKWNKDPEAKKAFTEFLERQKRHDR